MISNDGRMLVLGALGVLAGVSAYRSRGSRSEGLCPHCGRVHSGGGPGTNQHGGAGGQPGHGLPHPAVPLDGDWPGPGPKEIGEVLTGDVSHIERVIEGLVKKGLLPKGTKIDVREIADAMGEMDGGDAGEIFSDREAQGQGQGQGQGKGQGQKKPPCPPPDPTFTDAEIREAWNAAKRNWTGVTMTEAIAVKPEEGIAWINLKTRQVHVNLFTLTCKHAEDCLETLFAHELGHHMWYPNTIRIDAEVTVARMAVWLTMSKQKGEVAGPKDNRVENLSYDYLINTRLAKQKPIYQEKFVKLYQALDEGKREMSPPFAAYMAAYEVAWGLDEGALTRPTPLLDAERPKWREAVRKFVRLSRDYGRQVPGNPIPLLAQHLLFVNMIHPFYALEANRLKNRKPSGGAGVRPGGYTPMGP